MKSLSPDTRAQPNRCGALFVSGGRARTAYPCQPLDASRSTARQNPTHSSPPRCRPMIVRPWLAGLRAAAISLLVPKRRAAADPTGARHDQAERQDQEGRQGREESPGQEGEGALNRGRASKRAPRSHTRSSAGQGQSARGRHTRSSHTPRPRSRTQGHAASLGHPAHRGSKPARHPPRRARRAPHGRRRSQARQTPTLARLRHRRASRHDPRLRRHLRDAGHHLGHRNAVVPGTSHDRGADLHAWRTRA